MNTKSIISLFFLIISTSLLAQTSKVFDNLSMHSKILDMDRNYAIYLPPDYDSSERSYPVLYLLHGAGDDHTGWVQFGEVKHIADETISSGKSTAMIIVMPDAQTGERGYFNDINNEWRYEDFFFEEFIPYIEKTYRIKSQKRYRAISGLSMGGGGSLIYAMHHPKLFSSSCPLSAYTGPLSEESLKRRMNQSKKNYKESDLSEYFKQHSGTELAKTIPQKELKSVRWYIDCGDDDFLFEGNSMLHITLNKREVAHEYRVRDGAHNWTYWRTSLPEVLHFVSQGFHQY